MVRSFSAVLRGAALFGLLALISLSPVRADEGGTPAHADQPVKIPPGMRLQHQNGSDAVSAWDTARTSGGGSKTSGGGSSLSLPNWTYSIQSSRDGKTYSGKVVGNNPATGGTSVVPTYIIPVKLVFKYSSTTSYVFDPTATDPGCLGNATNTAISLTTASPIFQNYPFTLVNSGDDSTQYSDHFNRANFYHNTVAAGGYHTLLSPIVEPVQTVTLTASNSVFSNATVYSASGQCGTNTGSTNLPGYLGVVNINTWDPIARSLITSLGLNAAELPLFVFYNAAMSQGAASNLNNCCILGYHNAAGSPTQTYAVAEFEGRDGTLFSNVSDVASMSHEINEWMQDPGGANATPAWGGIGQVTGCQSNYEVGDPLSGTLLPAVPGINVAFTYHLQELAFFSWFYGGPSIAINGWYSDNNTFGKTAAVCPPGGV
jgi:hypothetical protein